MAVVTGLVALVVLVPVLVVPLGQSPAEAVPVAAVADLIAPAPGPTTSPSPTPTSTPTSTASPTPTPTPGATTATRRPAGVPDRVDRSWPAHPPWDACPRPVWPGTPAVGQPGDGRHVLLLGDSLTRESRTLTARALRSSGWTPTFRCWGSRRLDWGIAQIARAKELDQLPSVVVVALGTNDISWVDEATTARRVDSLLDRLGPRRQILWVDLHLTRSAWLDARAARFNAMLRTQARSRDNLTVVGWHKVAAAHRIRGGDGIHYGPAGYRLRAKEVAAAVDSAAPRLPARPAPAPIPAPTTTPSPTPSATPGATPPASASPSPSPSPAAVPLPGMPSITAR